MLRIYFDYVMVKMFLRNLRDNAENVVVYMNLFLRRKFFFCFGDKKFWVISGNMEYKIIIGDKINFGEFERKDFRGLNLRNYIIERLEEEVFRKGF